MEKSNTILDRLTSIEKSLKELEVKGKYQSLIEKNEFFSFFNTLSTISIFLIIGYYLNINEPDSFYRNIWFWASLFSKLILYILIINYIYRFKFVKYFYELKFTKVITTFIFSAITLFCNSKASSLINDIFGISAHDLPYSLTFTTFFYLFNYISNVLLIIGTICLFGLVIFCVVDTFQDRNARPDQNWWTIIVLLIFALTTFGFQNKEVSEISIRYKAQQLALQMDFNKNHYCNNINEFYSVAFIGSNQDKVIINTSPINQEVTNFENFLIKIPSHASFIPEKNNYPVVICEAQIIN